MGLRDSEWSYLAAKVMADIFGTARQDSNVITSQTRNLLLGKYVFLELGNTLYDRWISEEWRNRSRGVYLEACYRKISIGPRDENNERWVQWKEYYVWCGTSNQIDYSVLKRRKRTPKWLCLRAVFEFREEYKLRRDEIINYQPATRRT